MSEHSHEPLADETLRLVSSVQDWARRNFPTDAEHQTSDCQWCPLCQFVGVLRGDRPEVSARVAEAGTAVLGAMRALLEAAAEGASNGQSGSPNSAPDSASGGEASSATSSARHAAQEQPASQEQRRPRVQRINLSDES